MTIEMRYNNFKSIDNIMINRDQTLLAVYTNGSIFDIYSMETGIHVSNYG